MLNDNNKIDMYKKRRQPVIFFISQYNGGGTPIFRNYPNKGEHKYVKETLFSIWNSFSQKFVTKIKFTFIEF